MRSKFNVFVAGGGGIGRAVALLLSDDHELNCNIYIGDITLSNAEKAVQWVQKGIDNGTQFFPIEMPKEGSSESMNEAFRECDIILDCLPGSQAPRMARFAKQFGMHYANLTEYVAETEAIVSIANDADTGFILQTGLAPGFINILGHHLFQKFCKQYEVEKIDNLSMRVGALTKHTKSPHFYGFTWSPIGVATEYIKKSIAIRNGQKVLLPALSERENLLIDGVKYEADLTSGGAADLPDALLGKVTNLDYKTIRFPGHYDWAVGLIENIESENNKIATLEKEMLNNIPTVEDDIIIIYASATGRDKSGVLRSLESSFKIPPMKVGGQMLRGIQSTTAGPLAQSCKMLLTGDLKGVVFQSELNTNDFMNGSIVRRIYFGEKKRKVELV